MFKNPFSFDGRIRRLEYGISFLIYIAIQVFRILLVGETGPGGALIGLILIIPTLWFLWAQGAKRCHDIGRNGWWQIIPFYFVVLIFEDGKPGANQYGQNPKGVPGPDGEYFIESETLDANIRN